MLKLIRLYLGSYGHIRVHDGCPYLRNEMKMKVSIKHYYLFHSESTIVTTGQGKIPVSITIQGICNYVWQVNKMKIGIFKVYLRSIKYGVWGP